MRANITVTEIPLTPEQRASLTTRAEALPGPDQDGPVSRSFPMGRLLLYVRAVTALFQSEELLRVSIDAAAFEVAAEECDQVGQDFIVHADRTLAERFWATCEQLHRMGELLELERTKKERREEGRPGGADSLAQRNKASAFLARSRRLLLAWWQGAPDS